VLEDKDPGEIQSLCERLGLFDDRRVISLPPERPDEASRTLREVLARLVP
jgi:hypothetical protein